ncbi:MAG: MFS transporter [Thiolinea sp.]
MSTDSGKPYSRALMLSIFLPFAAGYFLSYLFRSINAIIAGDLSRDMGLDAGQLGFLTSVYLIAFAAAQLPLGIVLDRYGPRRTEAVLLLFAASGAAVFASADTLSGLLVGRALIGFGVSACLMAGFKAFVLWFPLQRLPMINGFLLTAGGLGVFAAAAPLEFTLQFTDWRGVFMVLAVVTFLVALLIFFVVPDKEQTQQHVTLKNQLQGLKSIFSSRVFWSVAPASVIIQGTAMSVTGLWSGPWLRDVAGLERNEIGFVLSFIGVGLILGYMLLGMISDLLVRRLSIPPLRVAISGMVIFLLVQLALVFEWTAFPALLWLVYTFFASSGVLMYAVLSQSFPPELAGRVNTSLNLLVFINAFLTQWGIGVVIDYFPGNSADTYNPDGYQAAFTIALVIQVLAMGWYFVAERRNVLRGRKIPA